MEFKVGDRVRLNAIGKVRWSGCHLPTDSVMLLTGQAKPDSFWFKPDNGTVSEHGWLHPEEMELAK